MGEPSAIPVQDENDCPIRVVHDRRRRQFQVRLNAARLRGLLGAATAQCKQCCFIPDLPCCLCGVFMLSLYGLPPGAVVFSCIMKGSGLLCQLDPKGSSHNTIPFIRKAQQGLHFPGRL
ncbi:uncharacterized protein [Narcine bancroftii]|uniref:uncharacterized protein isoform X2 n=1 Tax=Narcine bancroftii TaxID=1343680 RepID=UPI003831E130